MQTSGYTQVRIGILFQIAARLWNVTFPSSSIPQSLEKNIFLGRQVKNDYFPVRNKYFDYYHYFYCYYYYYQQWQQWWWQQQYQLYQLVVEVVRSSTSQEQEQLIVVVLIYFILVFFSLPMFKKIFNLCKFSHSL